MLGERQVGVHQPLSGQACAVGVHALACFLLRTHKNSLKAELQRRSLPAAGQVISFRPPALRNARPKRRAAALFAALICVLVVGLFSSIVVKQAISRHRQLQDDEKRLQAFWLAESAFELALVRLQTTPDYTGETWNTPPLEAVRGYQGRVEISVEPAAGAPGSLLLQIRASYPGQGPRRFTVSKELVLPKGSREEAS